MVNVPNRAVVFPRHAGTELRFKVNLEPDDGTTEEFLSARRFCLTRKGGPDSPSQGFLQSIPQVGLPSFLPARDYIFARLGLQISDSLDVSPSIILPVSLPCPTFSLYHNYIPSESRSSVRFVMSMRGSSRSSSSGVTELDINMPGIKLNALRTACTNNVAVSASSGLLPLLRDL